MELGGAGLPLQPGWVVTRQGPELVGFVNVLWMVSHMRGRKTRWSPSRRVVTGIGTKLVNQARDGAKTAGCEYLHVDFEDHLRPFYFGTCGFAPTNAGLLSLGRPAD